VRSRRSSTASLAPRAVYSGLLLLVLFILRLRDGILEGASPPRRGFAMKVSWRLLPLVVRPGGEAAVSILELRVAKIRGVS
jgi:hypothetical protein